MKKFKGQRIKYIIILILLISIVGYIYINNEYLNSSSDRTNILLFGIDSEGLSSEKGTRSDTIMLLSLDPSVKEPILISIPRDTRVKIPGRNTQEKINHAHAYGGTELLVKTVEEFLNLQIDYYVKINYLAVEEIVNAIGGVSIDVPIDMRYEDPYADPPLNINIKQGLQTLNGREALHFLRFRSGYANQDLGRIQAQQQFISAMVNKILSPSSVLKLPKLMEIFYSYVETNIPKSKSLFLGIKGIRNQQKEISKITLPGKPMYIDGISYYVVSDEDLLNIKENYLMKDTEVQSNTKVIVLNGCGVSGIAAKFSDKLQEEKIPVASIDNYDKNNIVDSFIEYFPDKRKDARKISKILGIEQLIEVTDEKYQFDVKVVIGKDLASQ